MLFMAMASVLISMMPLVTAELQGKYSFSGSEIGLLTSVLLFASAVVGIPVGFAAARWGGRMLALASGCVVLGSLLFAFSSSYGGFLAGRALQGIGAGSVVPICSPLMARCLSGRLRDRAWGIFGCGQGLGVIATLLILPSVEKAGGYRAVFLAVAIVCVVIAGVTLPQRSIRVLPEVSQGGATQGGSLRSLGTVAVNRKVLLLALMNGAAMAVTVGLLAWTPEFLQAHHSATLRTAAYLTAGVGLAQLVATPLGAAGMARWGKRFVLLLSLILMTLATVLVPGLPSQATVFACVVFIGFLAMVGFPPVLAAVPDVVHKADQVGPATGLVNVLAALVALLAPWLVGLVLDAYGTGAQQRGYLFGYLLLAAFPLLGTVGAVFIRLPKKTG